MNRAIRALVWEQLWRNLIVLPVLGVLLAIGAGLASALVNEQFRAEWGGPASGGVFIAFLCSLILGIAPFTLTESHGGWRMNSMVTRWFVLPVPTVVLVLVSLVLFGGFLSLLLAAWKPVIVKLLGKFDFYPFLSVWLLGACALQAVAWTVPRRPGQFWCVAGILFPVILTASFVTQESKAWIERREECFSVVGALVGLLAGIAWYVARKNRCGDWPGEISFGKVIDLILGLKPRVRQSRFPGISSIGADTVGAVIVFFSSWLLVSAVVVGVAVLMTMGNHWWRSAWEQIGVRTIVLIILQSVPLLTVLWLAAAGIYFGGEPGFGFRTQLSSFRATAPTSSGTLALQRLMTPILAWVAVWVPLLVLGYFYQLPNHIAPMTQRTEMYCALGRMMVISAHLLIGAMPFYLIGRIEGFPNMLLAAMLVWLAPCLLPTFIGQEDAGGTRALVLLGIWVLVKIGVAAWAAVHSLRAGEISWRFAAGLFGGWLLAIGLMTWGLPIWTKWGVMGLLSVAAPLPLARLALCPMAISANRHR